MSKIVAGTAALNSYAAKLESSANEFNNLLSSMSETVGAINGSWSGADSDAFIANASAYLHNLKAIKDALLEYGTMVKNCSVEYNNRVADFNSLLG